MIMNILNIKDVELNAGIINSQRLTTDYAHLLATFVIDLVLCLAKSQRTRSSTVAANEAPSCASPL